jgi:hypothetical protein
LERRIRKHCREESDITRVRIFVFSLTVGPGWYSQALR